MITLYRTVSTAERDDFNKDGQFRTSRNTLEGKQFFKSEEAVADYIRDTKIRGYIPEYTYLLRIELEVACLDKIPYEEQELDRFKAITIHEDYLIAFNKCIKFTTEYAV